MLEFLQAMLGFPTVVFTMLLGVVAVYWLFVIVGALDLHVLDGAHGATEIAHHAYRWPRRRNARGRRERPRA